MALNNNSEKVISFNTFSIYQTRVLFKVVNTMSTSFLKGGNNLLKIHIQCSNYHKYQFYLRVVYINLLLHRTKYWNLTVSENYNNYIMNDL